MEKNKENYKYRELSNEEKNVKRNYGRNKYINTSEEYQQKLSLKKLL